MHKIATTLAFLGLIIAHRNLLSEKPTAEQTRMLNEIHTYDGPRTFLLSFPRSGNTWLRYCLEFLTHRPSLVYHGFLQELQRPLGWSAHIPIDHKLAPIIKVHQQCEMPLCDSKAIQRAPNPDIDTLILVLRNPKECFARRTYYSWDDLISNPTAGIGYSVISYFENIVFFETWPEHMRLLIYYEDLILDPRATLTRILTFLHEPLTHLDAFMDTYKEQKQKCLALYPGSTSHGNDILFHSKKTSPDYHQRIDTWIAQAYPHIWNTYLREQYATKS